jgi:hypothetical protein
VCSTKVRFLPLLEVEGEGVEQRIAMALRLLTEKVDCDFKELDGVNIMAAYTQDFDF